MAKHKDFGTIRVRIQLPSNDDQKAIVGGVESQLDKIGGDIATAMLAIITGDTQKRKIGDLHNQTIPKPTIWEHTKNINDNISQIVNILSNPKGPSVFPRDLHGRPPQKLHSKRVCGREYIRRMISR